ncbi:MAG: hypothetical protein ACOYW9_09250 [Deinococcota bacterium]
MKLPIALALGTMALALPACTSGLRGNTPTYWGKELPPANAPLSRAYKEVIDKHYATFPPKEGECAKEIHARYWVYGPDGKVYPTWHPPVDPQTGCKFGHEHGHDPRESALYNGMPPFGYVNEKHFEYKDVNAEGYQGNFRDEDHVGHKIELQNNFTVYSDAGFAYTRCSVMMKLHQGTHSPDATKNNLHEFFYDIQCADGTELRWKSLHGFGQPGTMKDQCGDHTLVTGTDFVPPNSPADGGDRRIPGPSCVSDFRKDPKFWRFSEQWVLSHGAWADQGRLQVGFGPYFVVHDPSRYYDPSATTKIGRPVDFCFDGGITAGDCAKLRELEPSGKIAYDDPRSPFRGADRTVHMNGLRIKNVTGSTTWYSDVFGKTWSKTKDPAQGIVVEQFLRQGAQSDGTDIRGPTMEGDYGHEGTGVHAPN